MIKGKFSIKGIIDSKEELYKERVSSLRLTSSSYFKISGCLDSYLFTFATCHSQMSIRALNETSELNLYYFKTLPPGTPFELEAISSYNELYFFYFSNELLKETHSRYKIQGPLLISHFNKQAYVRKNNWLNEILHRYFFEIYAVKEKENSATDFLEKEIIKEVFYLGLNNTAKYCDRLNLDSQFLSGKSDLVKRLLLFVEANLDTHLSLNQIANKTTCSVSTIKRRFQDEMGLSIHEYIQTRRLEEAYKLLCSQKMNVTEVCSQVGFQSASSFSALFKKKYSMPPKKLIKSKA